MSTEAAKKSPEQIKLERDTRIRKGIEQVTAEVREDLERDLPHVIDLFESTHTSHIARALLARRYDVSRDPTWKRVIKRINKSQERYLLKP